MNAEVTTAVSETEVPALVAPAPDATEYQAWYSRSRLVDTGKTDDKGKKIKRREFLGIHEYTGFTLKAFQPEIAPGCEWELVTVGGDDLKATFYAPKYPNKYDAYLHSALDGKVQASAKGRITSGNLPQDTIDGLVDATGGGDFKKMEKLCNASILDTMRGAGVPPAAVADITNLLNPSSLMTAGPEAKAKMVKVVATYNRLQPELSQEYAGIIGRIVEAIEYEHDAGSMDISALDAIGSDIEEEEGDEG